MEILANFLVEFSPVGTAFYRHTQGNRKLDRAFHFLAEERDCPLDDFRLVGTFQNQFVVDLKQKARSVVGFL